MAVVIYRAHPGNDLAAAMRTLLDGGFHPEVIDRIDPVLRHFAAGMMKVRIIVPDEEADGAHEAIAAWESQTKEASRTYIEEFHTDLRWSLAIMAVTAVVLWVLSPRFGVGSCLLVLGAGFVSLLLVGNLRSLVRFLKDRA
jgi:hypothetical protein